MFHLLTLCLSTFDPLNTFALHCNLADGLLKFYQETIPHTVFLCITGYQLPLTFLHLIVPLLFLHLISSFVFSVLSFFLSVTYLNSVFACGYFQVWIQKHHGIHFSSSLAGWTRKIINTFKTLTFEFN